MGPARKVWRAAKPHVPIKARRGVTRLKRAVARRRAGQATLGTGLLRDRPWIPAAVTAKARATVRQARTR